MKARVKYHFALFILLLIGFTQVFTPVYCANVSPAPTQHLSGHDYLQVHILQVADLEGLEIEEEIKRSASKEDVRDILDLTFDQLSQQYFQQLKNHSSFSRYSTSVSLFSSRNHAFDVLRL